MRCIDCGFLETSEEGINFCRLLDEDLKHDVMENCIAGCPYDERKFEEESENEQRARRALEDNKQENIWRVLKRLSGVEM